MLTGVFAILFGLGILWNSLFLMFVFTPLFVLMNVLELKLIEEPELEMRLERPTSSTSKGCRCSSQGSG